MKAYIRNSRLDDAFRMYELMKKRETWPSTVVYNTLILGCLQAYDYKRAWGVFEHIKYEIGRPDEYSYTLMINACAKNNQVEKAINLFEEMISSGLNPNDVTCNTLISACARQPRYFDEAFSLIDKMEQMGFAPDYYTYNTLIYACAKRKQLGLARSIFAKLYNQVKTDTTGLIKIDDVTFTNILLALSSHLPCSQTWSRKRVLQNDSVGSDSSKPQDIAESDTTAIAASTTTTSIDITTQSNLPLLSACPKTYFEVATEARLLYNHFLENVLRSDDIVTPQLLIAYMATFTNTGFYNDAWKVYDEEFPRLGVKRNGWTYQRAFECCERMRSVEKAWKVWDEYKAWQNQSESMIQSRSLRIPEEKEKALLQAPQPPEVKGTHQHQQSSVPTKVADVAEIAVLPTFSEDQSKALTPNEQESVRTKIGRGKDMEFKVYKTMINLLGKNDQLRSALPLLKELNHGLAYCKHDLSIEDFSTIYSRAVQLEDSDTRAQLLALCRPKVNLTMKRLHRKWNTPLPFDVGKRKRASLKHRFPEAFSKAQPSKATNRRSNL